MGDTATSGVSVEQSGPNIVGDTNHNLLFDPGETWSFTGTRTLSADDIANGVADTSTASALGPQNQPASATATFNVPRLSRSSGAANQAKVAGWVTKTFDPCTVTLRRSHDEVVRASKGDGHDGATCRLRRRLGRSSFEARFARASG